MSPRTIPNEHPVGGTKIVLRNHTVYTLAMLAVQSDSAVGFDASGQRVAIPLRDVAGVQTREFSAARTALLFVAIPGVAFATLILLIIIECSGGRCG